MTVRNFIITSLILLSLTPDGRAQERGVGIRTDSQRHKRIALVIGNAAYSVGPLKNPLNDAKDMEQTLTALGFEVIYKENVSQKDMKLAIRSFGEQLRGGGAGLFYYAGHGIQVKGENYLIPVDAVIDNEEEVEFEAVNIGFVLAQMEAAHNGTNIIILDACRNNPFSRSWRSASRGLALMSAPAGTLIAYATAPGSVASDGDQRNGIYTQELLKNIRTPRLSVEEVMKRVRISVLSLTGRQQIPWESSSLTGDFYFATSGSESTNNAALEATKDDTPAGSPTYYERRGSKLQGERKYPEAEAEYRRGLQVDPKHKMLHILLGVVLTYQKQYSEAIDEYKKVLALYPDDWNAAVNLASVYANYGFGDSGEALRYAQLNVKRYPKDAVFEDVLGWVYYRMEMYPEAVEYLQRAVDRVYTISFFHFHLGMALARKGEKARAQIELEESLRRSDLEPEQAEQAQYTLKLLKAVEREPPAKGSPASSPGNQNPGTNAGDQNFERTLKGVMWLEHYTSIDGAPVFLEFEPSGRVRTRTPKDMDGYVAANVTWYMSGGTLHCLTFADAFKKEITSEGQGAIKGDRIEGSFSYTNSAGTKETIKWLLTKVIQ